ncbi:chondroitin 4-O-sulfotransferase [Paraburkholderia sp. MMS20-SJTN17]|uniref:Chondroitin 4-O-sulfotransferase n=1 Tax=Paraburkholderia translucens TaxID=2886945 RepID=A0ABS8K929_9BURK|nr:chondroitin 4-O-sulfotransferase [Paraburkholderia sp. MMS20-SJTN17]MCC8401250.1 chondroitin 4-O-sulfotransferase [Paraburkholderia sp. MMS20-SJTN17]
MSFPIFFIHPPKCGGSTVISFFDLNKGNDRFVNFVWDQDGWESCRAKLLETQVGGGHLPYGIHRVIKHPVNYCTILRDPLARQISHYLYAANGKNGEVTRGVSVSMPEALAQQGVLSLDEWVSESLGGRNLFVQMLSGEPAVNEASLAVAQINLREQISTVGVCEEMSEFLLRLCGSTGMKLPFYFETNRTNGAPKGHAQVSEAARQKFIEDNSLDYALFRDANRIVEDHANETGSVFSNALELVRLIQAEINQLDNPHVYSSSVFGFDGSFLARVHDVIRRFDLAPINAYLEFAQNRQRPPADLFDGFVDTVRDGAVYGWAVNLSEPERQVPLEVRVGTQIVATGLSGDPRPDVASAGYPSSRSGFSIALPGGMPDGFRVTIANSTESLHNAGTWRQGWHCE